MGLIIGIDLGTTYSAVAIPEPRTGEGFYTLREFPGYAVILDNRKRRIMPSVVAEDDKGQIVVGHEAKGRAGMSPEPIMFSKRWMGQDKKFQLAKRGTLAPPDVAAHILRQLKQLAELRLGATVEEAVITVPAYFSQSAKELTVAAAEKAGLRVAQLAQEPVAAAIMYCTNDTRDPLRVMTYDLGGGTFDVAILEKRDGTISSSSMLAFDGDPFLGGYDFDKILAQWLVDQLLSSGYDLHLDMTEVGDREIFAKLMVMAEEIKIALSGKELVEIRNQTTGVRDHRGESVTIELDVTRDQFESMIETQVNYTIGLCRRAMAEKAKPAVDPGTLDEILMVGGSSRIPMIGRRLREEFGREPRLVEPDLCVALGAAVIAGACPATTGCLRMGRIPAETDLMEIEVSGNVVTAAGLPNVEGSGVTLRAMDGSYRVTKTVRGADGAFLFSHIGLGEGQTTDFSLTVAAPSGGEVASRRFSVKQTATPRGAGLVELVPNVLSKPIGILWVEGLEVIAPERTPLPFETTLKAFTADTSGRIRAAVMEGTTPLGEIVVSGLPPSLPVGSEVSVTVSIKNDFKIHVRAWITALSKENTAVIDIPVRPMKQVSELQREFDTLSARAQDALNAAGANVLFGDAKAQRLHDRQADCRRMLAEPNPDVAKVQACIDEIESLVRDVGQGWKPIPPKAVFDHAVKEAHEMLARAQKANPDIAKDGYGEQIEAIRAEGVKAYTAQNPAAWKESYDKLTAVGDRLSGLEEKGQKSGGDQPKQDPVVLLMQLSRELDSLEKSAKSDGRYIKFQDEFTDLRGRLQRIDPKSPDAMSQIYDWYNTGLRALKEAMARPDADGTMSRGAAGKGR